MGLIAAHPTSIQIGSGHWSCQATGDAGGNDYQWFENVTDVGHTGADG
jgi:hypothetical protein